MRYSQNHKEQTHARLVRTAASRFRGNGTEGLSIGDLMAELGLTHGGFYRHFDSKEQLFAEAFAFAFEERGELIVHAVSNAKAGFELRTMIEKYLSLEHCAHSAEGCPAAALAAEVARHPLPVRFRYETAMVAYGSRFVKFLPGPTKEQRRKNVLVLFSGMAGALTMARAVADPELRRTILASAREFYIAAFCNSSRDE